MKEEEEKEEEEEEEKVEEVEVEEEGLEVATPALVHYNRDRK